jgi:A/G-specific adenine glycosylase
MLQQTQIATGLPYYNRWMEHFPTVESLARAEEEQAMAMWQGLGYYRRCRMLHQAAKQVVATGFPKSRDEWLKIPGVGRYTAAAIASICLGEPTAVVDGNVERVYARMKCDPAIGSKLKTNTWIWADEQMVPEQPGEWNQAVMELGARVCKPTQPQCQVCPVSLYCLSFQTNRVTEFPSPKPKPTTVKYEEELVIPLFGDEIGFLTSHDLKWWKGLSLLPLSSTFNHSDSKPCFTHLGEVQYTVTNHKITALISCARFDVKPDGLTWVHQAMLDKVPLPAPHRKALQLLYKT